MFPKWKNKQLGLQITRSLEVVHALNKYLLSMEHWPASGYTVAIFKDNDRATDIIYIKEDTVRCRVADKADV